MIIKTADDKQPQIEALQNLLNHPNADTGTKKRIEQDIRNIHAGVRGEEEASYEMKVHYGESKNWMVLNDLRIEHGDLVAQIDHMLINRFMEIWVCESKHFSEGIAINEHSEFSAFWGSKPYGVPSPIEQNHKHIVILKRVFDSGAVNLPKRMGFTIKPDLKSLVLVSKKARITRPKTKITGLECIIKHDQLFKTIDKSVNDNNNPLLMAKLIGQDTLEELGRDICRLHKPLAYNWTAKYGLPTQATPIAAVVSGNQIAEPAAQPTVKSIPNKISCPKVQDSKVDEELPKTKKKLICHTCGEPVAYNVAKFCWFNKPRFGENIYCMNCQKDVPAKTL